MAVERWRDEGWGRPGRDRQEPPVPTLFVRRGTHGGLAPPDGSPASPGRRRADPQGSRLFCPPLGVLQHSAWTPSPTRHPDRGYRSRPASGREHGRGLRGGPAQPGRRVALKVLAPKLADDDVFRRRFLRESRIAASIDHPSIIPIYETGEDGGLLYIAMRYVDGSDLATLLEREGRLEPARAMAIMTQVASALDAAHTRGLVHRDVKPANILLAAAAPGAGSHCYLCDFGLIKQVGTEQAFSALTATDQFVGTIPYVAPEQIEGREVDGRTDVYALGCVLFHCLTGSVPYQGENDVEVVFAHLREPQPSCQPSSRLPTAMDAVVTRPWPVQGDRGPNCSPWSRMQAEVRSTPAPATPSRRDTVLHLPPVAITTHPFPSPTRSLTLRAHRGSLQPRPTRVAHPPPHPGSGQLPPTWGRVRFRPPGFASASAARQDEQPGPSATGLSSTRLRRGPRRGRVEDLAGRSRG